MWALVVLSLLGMIPGGLIIASKTAFLSTPEGRLNSGVWAGIALAVALIQYFIPRSTGIGLGEVLLFIAIPFWSATMTPFIYSLWANEQREKKEPVVVNEPINVDERINDILKKNRDSR